MQNPLTLLQSFTCERISTDRQNKRLVQSFVCQGNETLTEYIRKKAWNDDATNRRAVYLIKHGEIPLFFFSLQCGSMYEQYDRNMLEQSFSNFKELEPYIEDLEDFTNEEDITGHIIKLVDAGIISETQFAELMRKYHNSGQARRIEQDKREDPANKLPRVYKSSPVVELVHFCANAKVKEGVWNADLFKRKLGESIFYQFISPIVEEVSKKIGCTDLYLFASDGSREERLICYYIGQMNFKRDERLQPKKTYFSLFCTALSQKIQNLERNKNRFFADYIPNTNSEDFI